MEEVEAKEDAESVESILRRGEGKDPERFPLSTDGVPAALSILAINRDSIRDLGLPSDGGEVAKFDKDVKEVEGWGVCGGLGVLPGGGVALRTWDVMVGMKWHLELSHKIRHKIYENVLLFTFLHFTSTKSKKYKMFTLFFCPHQPNNQFSC